MLKGTSRLAAKAGLLTMRQRFTKTSASCLSRWPGEDIRGNRLVWATIVYNFITFQMLQSLLKPPGSYYYLHLLNTK